MLCLLAAGSVEATTYKENGRRIPEEDSVYADDSIHDGYEIKYYVKVTGGSPIDVYVLNEAEWQKYMDEEMFYPLASHEHVTMVDEKYEVEDDGPYYVVLDNMDNARSDDAQSEGSVYVNYEIEFSAISDKDIETIVYFCCSGVIVIAVVVVLAYVFLYRPKARERKRSYVTPVARPELYQKGYPRYPGQQPYGGPVPGPGSYIPQSLGRHQYQYQYPQQPHRQPYHGPPPRQVAAQRHQFPTPSPPPDRCPSCGSRGQYSEEYQDFYCWTCEAYFEDMQ